MSDADDSNSGFELMSSQPEKQTYSSAPEDAIYKLKVKPIMGSSRKMSYRLKKGTSLPYTTLTGG